MARFYFYCKWLTVNARQFCFFKWNNGTVCCPVMLQEWHWQGKKIYKYGLCNEFSNHWPIWKVNVEQTHCSSGYCVVLPVGSLGEGSGLAEVSGCCERKQNLWVSWLCHCPSLVLLIRLSNSSVLWIESLLFLTVKYHCLLPARTTMRFVNPEILVVAYSSRVIKAISSSEEMKNGSAWCSQLCLGLWARRTNSGKYKAAVVRYLELCTQTAA